MILIDTSAIYALADRADANHSIALDRFSRLLQDRLILVLHNYILIEALALLQHRLGLASAVAFAESSTSFDTRWVTEDVHREAAVRWKRGKRNVSFVDHVSFVVMQQAAIQTAFAFDSDFESAGFQLVG